MHNQEQAGATELQPFLNEWWAVKG